MISKVKDAVKGVAQTIANFLHFSVPDEGPLSEYESWMPGFMKGMAEGIEKSKYLVQKAVGSLADDMLVSPNVRMGQMTGYVEGSGSGSVSGSDLNSVIGAIREGIAGVGRNSGDIVIPVYLGGTLLDEAVVSAQQRANLRSGGR